MICFPATTLAVDGRTLPLGKTLRNPIKYADGGIGIFGKAPKGHYVLLGDLLATQRHGLRTGALVHGNFLSGMVGTSLRLVSMSNKDIRRLFVSIHWNIPQGRQCPIRVHIAHEFRAIELFVLC